MNAICLSAATESTPEVIISNDDGRFSFVVKSKDGVRVIPIGTEMSADAAIAAAIAMIKLVVQSVPKSEQERIMRLLREKLPDLFDS